MSNPYIQFELDAAKKAPLLASALGLQIRDVFGGLTMMWLHAYSEGDVVTLFLLRSFFGCDGALAAEGLVELGFIEAIDARSWRVKGAGRYTRLAEIRRAAGVKGREKQLAEAGSTGGRAGHAGQNVDLPGQTPGKTPETDTLPGQDSGKTDPDACLPGQKRALEPITERASSSKKQSSQQPRAPAHHERPAEVATPPPDPRVAAALALWQKHFAATVPTGMVDDASVLSVANDFTPEDFAAGVERHCDEGLAYWVKTPIRFLRLRCEWARDDAAKRAAAPPPASVRGYGGKTSRAPRGEAY